jgi:hypothetical protein
MFKRIINLTIAFITATVLLTPAMALAATPKSQVCSGAGLGADCTTGGTNVPTIVTRAIQLFSVILGLVAVVMVLIAGLKYMTSNGDAGQVASAKNTLMYAIIGIIVAALAQAIVKYVIKNTA